MTKKRTPKQRKLLAKKIIEYYFDNPQANNYKIIMEKFKTDETFIRKSLSDELEKRFNNAQRIRNL
tara:strand:+ start:573 stop:770 length:198 start_codon:yes stop_codon:yes gene_type:complete